MIPFDFPPGLSIRDALVDLLPREHARRVPRGVGAPPYCAVLKVRGDKGGCFTLRVQGDSMTVAEEESAQRDLWLVTDAATVRRFLDDGAGPHEIVPRELAGTPGVHIATDPRLIARVRMINGSVRASLTGVPGSPETIWIAVGTGTRVIRYADEHEPDAELEVPFAVYRAIVAGRKGLADASGAGEIRIRGSKLLAGQLGLAMALLTPLGK